MCVISMILPMGEDWENNCFVICAGRDKEQEQVP